MSKCESCGVDWTDHLGITGTCKLVQDQAEEIAKLKAEIERLHKFEREQIYDFRQAAKHSASCNEIPGEW